MANDRKYAAPVNITAGGSSFGNAAAVTPSDSTPLTEAAAALWVGGAGNLVVITISGQTVTFSAVAAGTLLPISVSSVKSTGTTATLILALW
ncbi:MAG TPA: hypothetical protein VH592_21115 [Gemmataceae bacterium]|jgi:hypothetical protein